MITPDERRELERLIDAKVYAAIGYGAGAESAKPQLSAAGEELTHQLDQLTDYRPART